MTKGATSGGTHGGFRAGSWFGTAREIVFEGTGGGVNGRRVGIFLETQPFSWQKGETYRNIWHEKENQNQNISRGANDPTPGRLRGATEDRGIVWVGSTGEINGR